MILKPKDKPKVIFPAVQTYSGGREVCSNNTSGKKEYRRRTLAMRDRQNFLCRLCGLWMAEYDTTFDHFNGRGAGKRDDRIEVDGVE